MWKRELTRLAPVPPEVEVLAGSENNELTVSTKQGVEVYGRAPGGRRRYRKRAGELRKAPVGKPATGKEGADGCLKVIGTGPPMATVGRDTAREYYASRPSQKRGTRHEIFDMVEWATSPKRSRSGARCSKCGMQNKVRGSAEWVSG